MNDALQLVCDPLQDRPAGLLVTLPAPDGRIGNFYNVQVFNRTGADMRFEVGAVDVVITNPDGRSATLAGGFTYLVVTLTANPSQVGPGGAFSVTWTWRARR